MNATAGPYIAVWVISILLGAAIGSGRGQGGTGAVLGLLLGPLGVLFALTLKPSAETQALREQELEAARAQLRAQTAPQTAAYTPQPEVRRDDTDPWGDSPLRQRG